jgi:hypothetical protein
MLRLGAPRWAYLILGVLPPAVLLLAAPSLRVKGPLAMREAACASRVNRENGATPERWKVPPIAGSTPANVLIAVRLVMDM